jgi:hypothetical protein
VQYEISNITIGGAAWEACSATWNLGTNCTNSSATYIFPAKCCFAALTIDVSNSMESREKYSLFCRPTTNIHPETSYSYVQYLINCEQEQIAKLTSQHNTRYKPREPHRGNLTMDFMRRRQEVKSFSKHMQFKLAH